MVPNGVIQIVIKKKAALGPAKLWRRGFEYVAVHDFSSAKSHMKDFQFGHLPSGHPGPSRRPGRSQRFAKLTLKPLSDPHHPLHRGQQQSQYSTRFVPRSWTRHRPKRSQWRRRESVKAQTATMTLARCNVLHVRKQARNLTSAVKIASRGIG